MVVSGKVFAIPELLENILLHLPLRDLLLSQNVCKPWHTSVQGSVSIRRALFLERSPDTTVQNLRRGSKKDEYGQAVEVAIWVAKGGAVMERLPIFNPFFIHLRTSDNYSGDGYLSLQHHGLVDPGTSDVQEGNRLRYSQVALHRPWASCKKMMVMQPASSKMTCRRREGFEEDLAIKNDEGVTMGEVVHKLQNHWLICPNCQVWQDEVNRWTFSDQDVELRTVDIEVSGWKMLAERK